MYKFTVLNFQFNGLRLNLKYTRINTDHVANNHVQSVDVT